MSAATLLLIVTLLKASATDFKQVGHNVKKVATFTAKVSKKAVRIFKHHTKPPALIPPSDTQTSPCLHFEDGPCMLIIPHVDPDDHPPDADDVRLLQAQKKENQ